MRERPALVSKLMTSALGPLELAGPHRRLDRVSVDTPDRRLAKVDALERLDRLRQMHVRSLDLAVRELGQAEAAQTDHRDDRLGRR